MIRLSFRKHGLQSRGVREVRTIFFGCLIHFILAAQAPSFGLRDERLPPPHIEPETTLREGVISHNTSGLIGKFCGIFVECFVLTRL